MPRIARLLSLLLTALFLSFAAQAQDEIHLKNGKILEGKVHEITPSSVKYKKGDDGPLYTINRRDVRRIVYENGETEEMTETLDDDNSRGHFKPGPNAKKFGKNVIALLPISMTDRSAVGFGLRYERTLDKNGYLSVMLPATISLRGLNNSNINTGSQNDDAGPFYQFYPGVRFYPASSRHVFAYAVGLNLMAGFGQEDFTEQVQVSPGVFRFQTGTTTNTRLGLMVSNSLNFAPTPRLHFGLELMLGFRYLNTYSNGYQPDNTWGNEMAPAVNFNLGFGYRF